MAVEVMTAVSLAVLFLPVLGPQLDHHFAERRPDHDHLFLGAAVPEHTHSFEGLHAHYHPIPGPGTANGGGSHQGTPAQRIVYLTSDQGFGQGPLDLASRVVQQSPVFPAHSANFRASGMVRNNVIPSSAFVGPPRKPPRV